MNDFEVYCDCCNKIRSEGGYCGNNSDEIKSEFCFCEDWEIENYER